MNHRIKIRIITWFSFKYRKIQTKPELWLYKIFVDELSRHHLKVVMSLKKKQRYQDKKAIVSYKKKKKQSVITIIILTKYQDSLPDAERGLC